MSILEEIKQKIEAWENRNKMIDKLLDDLSKTIEQTNKSMVSMQTAFDNMSSLLIKINGEYNQLKSEFEEFKNKIKNNRWMKMFGIN